MNIKTQLNLIYDAIMREDPDNCCLLIVVRPGQITARATSGTRKHSEALYKTIEEQLKAMKEGRY